jgi:hypothetical protein
MIEPAKIALFPNAGGSTGLWVFSFGLLVAQRTARKQHMNAALKQISLFVAGSALLFFLSGCATPYQPSGFGGGYSETQLAPDMFRTTFRGNGYTSAERTQDFAMLRAADLAMAHGFTCFAIIDERDSTDVSSFTTPGHADTTAYGTSDSSGNIYFNPYGASYSGTSSATVNAHTTYTPPQTYYIFKPSSGLLIRCFTVKPDAIYSFDAAFLQQSLRQKYKIKPPPNKSGSTATAP